MQISYTNKTPVSSTTPTIATTASSVTDNNSGCYGISATYNNNLNPGETITQWYFMVADTPNIDADDTSSARKDLIEATETNNNITADVYAFYDYINDINIPTFYYKPVALLSDGTYRYGDEQSYSPTTNILTANNTANWVTFDTYKFENGDTLFHRAGDPNNVLGKVVDTTDPNYFLLQPGLVGNGWDQKTSLGPANFLTMPEIIVNPASGYTFSCWFKEPYISTIDSFFSIATGGLIDVADYWRLTLENTDTSNITLRLTYKNNDTSQTYIVNGNQITQFVNDFVHIGFTLLTSNNQSTLVLYKNGKVENTETFNTNIVGTRSTNSNISFSFQNGGTYNGSHIDEVYIDNTRAISPCAMKTLYNKGMGISDRLT